MTIEEKKRALYELCAERIGNCDRCYFKNCDCTFNSLTDKTIDTYYDIAFSKDELVDETQQTEKKDTLNYEEEYHILVEELKIERMQKDDLEEKYKSLRQEAEVMRAQLAVLDLIFKKE